MKTIPLTRGMFALVDDSDFEEVSQFRWQAHRSRRGFYAAHTEARVNGTRRRILMHRLLLGVKSGDTDHRDGNGLNNQRDNLRVATHRQNLQAFQHKRAGTSSRFRGVSWHPANRKWRALIGLPGKVKHLGMFTHEEDAARAYDAAARQFFGEFASPNFPV